MGVVRKSSAKDPLAAFAATVAKAAKPLPVSDLGVALGDLVKLRLKPKPKPAQPAWRGASTVPATTQRQGGTRRTARRVGRFKSYTATAMTDTSRFGTFRRYMITTIRAHTNTHAANVAHAACDNPKFAKNKLDFNWAADNGYITFN